MRNVLAFPLLLALASLTVGQALAQADPKKAKAVAAQRSPTAAVADPDKRHMEFHIAGTAKDTIYLASYFGNKLYYTDTTIADSKGTSVFKRPKGYKTGVYAVVVPGPKYFEIIVNEPEMLMETDTVDLSGHLVVKKSRENQIFLDYVRYLNEQRKQADEVNKKILATEDKVALAELREKLKGYDKVIRDYQQDLVLKNPGTFVGSIVKMSIAPEQLDIKKPDGTTDSAATYYYYRAHFWDNVDLTDERILHTPVFQNKFDEYVGKVMPQVPDTINALADDLVRRMDHGDELFKFAVHNITYRYETSDIMGMDAVFVHMAQTYYCPVDGTPGRATWMPKDKLDKLCERAKKEAPLIIGAKAKDIILPDTTEQKWIDMYKMPQEWLLVVFWVPHCGHCKKALPDLYTQYVEKLRPLNVEVFSVAKATDSVLFADWKSFIIEHKMDWTNVGLTWHVYAEAKKNPGKYIPGMTTIESLNYSDAWDVYSTPKMFLLDSERKIVGKQLTADQVVDLIANLKRIKARKEKEKSGQ